MLQELLKAALASVSIGLVGYVLDKVGTVLAEDSNARVARVGQVLRAIGVDLPEAWAAIKGRK